MSTGTIARKCTYGIDDDRYIANVIGAGALNDATLNPTTSYVNGAVVPGAINELVLTFNAYPLAITDDGSTGSASVKLWDFDTNVIEFIDYTTDLDIAVTTSWTPTTPVLALSTNTLAAGASFLTAEANIAPSYAITIGSNAATWNQAGNCPVKGATFDGSTTAKDLYLNFKCNSDPSTSKVLTFTGTIKLRFRMFGDGIPLTTAPTRMPTASLWSNCPWDELAAGRRDGFVLFNDLVTGNYTQTNNVAASATTIIDGGMCAFTGATAGGTIGPKLDSPYGVVDLLNTTDGETTILQALGNKNIAGQVVFEAGRRVWFETRVKIANTTTNQHDIFVGFAEEGLAVNAGVITAADALVDKDMIGFNKLGAATTAVAITHNTAGGGGVTNLATATTIAADTWANFGIYCDGTTVFFYKDGTLITSVLLAATNFPDGEEMALYFVLVVGSGGGDCILSVDWFKVAMERA